MKTHDEIRSAIENRSARSAWSKGVTQYALELYDYYLEGQRFAKRDLNEIPTMKALLNGARDWFQYSYAGCSLISDYEICERLATPSEQKRKKYGELRPNSNEEWLDVQARALKQAAYVVMRLAK